MDKKSALEYFPTKTVVGKINPLRLKYFILGPPKWGKTTFFTGAPNVLLLAFEEGHLFARCHKIVMNAWYVGKGERGVYEDDDGVKYTSALEIIEALEIGNTYDMVIMDTADMASKMCSDYECEKGKIAHPSDGGDYGKGWDLYQTTPFRRFYNRLVKLGVGIVCTTHVKEGWYKDRFKQDVFRRESSLPGGVQKFIHSQSDVILHGFFGNLRKGQKSRDRIISFDGTDEIMAGTRLNAEVYMPNKYIVDPPTVENPRAPWDQWKSFFDNSPIAGQAADMAYKILRKKGAADESEAIDTKSIEPQVENKVI